MGTDDRGAGGNRFSSLDYRIHEGFASAKERREAEEERTDQDVSEDYILPH